MSSVLHTQILRDTHTHTHTKKLLLFCLCSVDRFSLLHTGLLLVIFFSSFVYSYERCLSTGCCCCPYAAVLTPSIITITTTTTHNWAKHSAYIVQYSTLSHDIRRRGEEKGREGKGKEKIEFTPVIYYDFHSRTAQSSEAWRQTRVVTSARLLPPRPPLNLALLLFFFYSITLRCVLVVLALGERVCGGTRQEFDLLLPLPPPLTNIFVSERWWWWCTAAAAASSRFIFISCNEEEEEEEGECCYQIESRIRNVMLLLFDPLDRTSPPGRRLFTQ